MILHSTTYVSKLVRLQRVEISGIPLNSKRDIAHYDIILRDIAMNKHVWGIVKVRHPIFWYQLLLIFALGDGAPAKLVGFRTSDLTVNLTRDPF